MTERRITGRIGGALREVLTWTAIAVGTLLLFEGAASALMFVRDRKGANPPKQLVRPRTAPDTLLGWRNATSYANADEYGKGIAMSTTSDGLRTSAAAVSPATASAESEQGRGIVCSGDAFTFGTGVADDRHWCARLAAELSGVRTFDMAQESYGLDQSYLWYRRDGRRFPHRIQILAVTNASLERALSADDAGWLKPRLELEGDRLAARNVPVPKQTRDALEHAAFMRGFDELRIVQAVQRVPAFDPGRRRAARVESNRPLFEKLVDELSALHQARGTRLVLAYLPSLQEVRSERMAARHQWIADVARRRGIPLVDLTPVLRGLRADSLDVAFISRTSPTVQPRAAGYYSNLGHALVARALARELAPQLASAAPREARVADVPRTPERR